jgi:TonB family protein
MAIGASFAGGPSSSVVVESWSETVRVVAAPIAPGGTAWLSGPILLSVWAAGFAVVAAVWLRRLLALRAVVRAARAESATLLAGRTTIAILRSEAAVEPGIVGLVRPVLVLPAGLEDRLSPAQLESVLAHEACHITRRDNWTAAAHMLVEAVFWFHPLSWWIGRRLVDERECACDEMVIAAGHDAETYAEGILRVCEVFTPSPLRCAAGISGIELKRRIVRIMQFDGNDDLGAGKQLLLGAAATLTVATLLVAGCQTQQMAVAAIDRCRNPEFLPTIQGFSFADYENGVYPEGAYLPMVKVAPIYPPQAAQQGLEGYVIVDYTVAADGNTEDVVVVETSSPLFDRPAVDSATRYRYKPCVIDGEPVAVPGVRTRIEFVLENTAANEPERNIRITEMPEETFIVVN